MALDDFSLDEVAIASNETDLVCTLSSDSLSSRTDKYLSARLPCKQPFSDYTITVRIIDLILFIMTFTYFILSSNFFLCSFEFYSR
jgi:hypothetical protein